MDIKSIVSELDTEISRLTQAKTLLSGEPPITRAYVHKQHSGWKKVLDTTPKPVKRTISAAGRKRIAAAQRARWAKKKHEAKKAA